jgi:hypothetical protein
VATDTVIIELAAGIAEQPADFFHHLLSGLPDRGASGVGARIFVS